MFEPAHHQRFVTLLDGPPVPRGPGARDTVLGVRSFSAVVASVLVFACGGGRTGNSRAAAKIEAAEVKTCSEACERVDTCWELQYGQEDGEAEQAECETRCDGMTPEIRI